jgi:hypothetical protein
MMAVKPGIVAKLTNQGRDESINGRSTFWAEWEESSVNKGSTSKRGVTVKCNKLEQSSDSEPQEDTVAANICDGTAIIAAPQV